MATGKKFYWIKLKKDFMSGDIVDFLMSQKNGAQYVVLYQMLCLMCINTQGALSRQIGELIIPFDTDKIYRDCKYFSRDTITIALGLFKKLGLVYEQDAGILAITGFDNLVGCETDYAVQKRNQRQITDNSIDSITDKSMDCIEDNDADSHVDNVHTEIPVHDERQCHDSNEDKDVDNVHTEKEIRDKRLDKEKDKMIITVSDETVCQTDVRRIVKAWNDLQRYGIKPVSRVSKESKRFKSLTARIREYGVECVLSAVDRIKISDFLKGRNKTGWTITFDWFVLPNNFPKVLEGNYDNQTGAEGNGYNQELFERLAKEDREDIDKRREKV